MLKTFLIGGGVAVLLSGLIFGFACYSLRVPGLYRIARNGTAIDGRVIEKQPKNRNHVKYSYEVGGKSFEGSDGVGARFETIKPGESIRVFYDPRDPGLSLLGTTPPYERFRDTVIVSAVFSTIVGFLSTLGILGFSFRLLSM